MKSLIGTIVNVFIYCWFFVVFFAINNTHRGTRFDEEKFNLNLKSKITFLVQTKIYP